MAELVGDPHATPRVVSILSSLLERVAEHNDRCGTTPTPTQTPTRKKGGAASAVSAAFQGVSKPGISVRSYLERIFRYANCSPSCYVVAYIYLDRFVHRHPALLIDSFNVHRLLITSVLTAVKFMDDIYYNNAYFAKVGGVSLMEMNYLEVDFLFGVGFELNVTPMVFTSYCSILQSEMYSECPPPPPPRILLCSLSEEDSTTTCQQKKQQQQQQLAAVREVFGT